MTQISQNLAFAQKARRGRATLSVAALAAAILTTGVGAPAGAQAQEAMMLERIGAVRMMRPEELRPAPLPPAHVVATSAPVTSLQPQGR